MAAPGTFKKTGFPNLPKDPVVKPPRTEERRHKVWPPNPRTTLAAPQPPISFTPGIDLPPPKEAPPVPPPPVRSVRTTGEIVQPVAVAVARKLVQPVGAALLLLASLAQGATTVVSQPNTGACPFPGCRGVTSWVDVSLPPYNASGGGTGDLTGSIQRAVDSGAAVVYFPAGLYPVCKLMPRALNPHGIRAGVRPAIISGTP